MGDRSDTPRWNHFFKRWHGSDAHTGTLSAWGMTGALSPWRDPGEGEPETIAHQVLVSRDVPELMREVVPIGLAIHET